MGYTYTNFHFYKYRLAKVPGSARESHINEIVNLRHLVCQLPRIYRIYPSLSMCLVKIKKRDRKFFAEIRISLEYFLNPYSYTRNINEFYLINYLIFLISAKILFGGNLQKLLYFCKINSKKLLFSLGTIIFWY